ncbi:MAG TPA: tyrosine-type recombinase/integrase [Gemmataceae bacterium]|jgi:integrase|nr:tyrosine-type recombinase/integrase [Gemmataceae bacterium]
MPDVDSSSPPVSGKPAKPYADFPLFPHATRRWAKKIRGKMHYFGPWEDPDGALAKYLEQKDALHAGRKPRAESEGLTVKELANAFLNAKQALEDAGELSPRTWTEYKAMADELVAHLGKSRLVADLDAEDFAALRNKLAKKWGPHRLKKAVQYIRSIFKHAYESDLIDRPVRYGPGFKRPSTKTLRLHRAKQGPKLFTADEIRAMVQGMLVVRTEGPEMVQASVQLKAMILLGINCGFGNADCATLPRSAVDLDTGWIDYPRPKTGISRRCPLWPETVRAIGDALTKRPEPKDPSDGGLVFITKYGLPWGKDIADSPVTKETRKLLDQLGIDGHRNFYTLRHTFRTVADEAKDQPAADFIMGHEVPHMSAVYRETISCARLKAVADYVRTWLFSEKGSER